MSTVGDVVGVYSDASFVTVEPDGRAYQETIVCFHAVAVGGSWELADGVWERNWLRPRELAWIDRRQDGVRHDMRAIIRSAAAEHTPANASESLD